MILSHFKNLYQHQEWADARMWRSVLESKEGNSDDHVQNTLMHIHETQHSFLNVWLERPFERWKRDEIGASAELCRWARSFHSKQHEFLDSLTEADLSNMAVVPWAKYFAKSMGHDPKETTLGETLHQVISHSMHHRGQVARRLRELEETPPLTDYIVWLWEDKTDSDWPQLEES